MDRMKSRRERFSTCWVRRLVLAKLLENVSDRPFAQAQVQGDVHDTYCLQGLQLTQQRVSAASDTYAHSAQG